MKIIYFASVLLFSLSLIASDIMYVSDSFLYTIKNKSFSEFIKALDLNPINALYKSNNFQNCPPKPAATILEHVCTYGEDDADKFKKIQWLVKKGAFITDQTICNVARLRHNDDVKIMSYLLHKSGNVNVTGMRGNDCYVSALHNAIFANFIHDHKIPMIELLLTSGANVNSKQSNGDTPLHYAARYCSNAGVVELLLVHGAQIDVENRYNKNVLHALAANSGSAAIIKIILKRTNLPLVNMKEFYYKDTPLHIAVKNIHNKPKDVIALLKCPHIDIEIQNSSNQTPLQIAKVFDHKTMGRILVKFKTIKYLLSQPTWGHPENLLPNPLNIPEKLLIHKIAYWVVKSEFAQVD